MSVKFRSRIWLNGWLGCRGSDFIIKNLPFRSVPLLHLSFLFTYVMALFSDTFFPRADKRWLPGSPPARSKIKKFLAALAPVQRGLWLPHLSRCQTQPQAKGRDCSLLPTLSGYAHLMAEDSISPTQLHEPN